jgi:hypothetical protein
MLDDVVHNESQYADKSLSVNTSFSYPSIFSAP